jgi:hypothetical protein
LNPSVVLNTSVGVIEPNPGAEIVECKRSCQMSMDSNKEATFDQLGCKNWSIEVSEGDLGLR